MRNTILALLLLFSWPLFVAGQQPARITGKINFSDDYVAYIQPFDPENASKEEGEEIPLSAGGTFSWSATEATDQWVQVTFMPKARDRQLGASFPLLVRANQVSHLDLNYDNATYLEVLKGSKMSGENWALISYSAFINRSTRERFENPKEGEDLQLFLKGYILQKEELLKKFKVKDKRVIRYLEVGAYNAQLETALTTRPFRKEWVEEDMVDKLSDGYLLSCYNGAYNLRQYLNILNKRDNFDSALGKLQSDALIIRKFVKDIRVSKALYSSLFSQFVTNYRVQDLSNLQRDLKEFQEVLNVLEDQDAANEYLSNLQRLSYTTKGSPKPEVSFKDLQGNEKKLDEFKGKYIYIDLWASWCVPCIKEVPYLKEIEKKYAGKDLAIISLSLDQNKEDWIKKVQELQLTGNQWHLGDSDFDKIMNVQGIPHFILYSPEGELIEYKAPRPSSKAIDELLSKLL